MDHSGRMVLRLVVCGYVCYLAWSLISDQLAGKSTMNDALAYFFRGRIGPGRPGLRHLHHRGVLEIPTQKRFGG